MTDSNGYPPVIECALPTEADAKNWEAKIREVNRDRCSNCGGVDHLVVQMVVPEEAGGQYVLSNGVLLCRGCVLARDTAQFAGSTGKRRPVNFWVSRTLYDELQQLSSFHSVSALVRYLMSTYVRSEALFDDLEYYQDSGSDVKINVWVDRDSYEVFKRLVNKRNLTVTDSIKSLICMYNLRDPKVSK